MSHSTASSVDSVPLPRAPARVLPGFLPGFGLSLGYTLFYLSLIVLVPLTALVMKAGSLSAGEFWAIATDERALAAYKVTFGSALAAASVNALFGFLIAWVLVRYPFPGRKLIDALVDLPFALPTAVAGITLATLYSEAGWIGKLLVPLGIDIAFTPYGIVVALIFISLPFVVRTLQPVIEDIEPEIEEAAATLGASRAQTVFRVIFPAIAPAWITGFTLAFARAIGEYGSVIFIAGNMPFKSEITPFLIYSKLDQHDLTGATVLAVVMLLLSFLLLLCINALQRWAGNRHRRGTEKKKTVRGTAGDARQLEGATA